MMTVAALFAAVALLPAISGPVASGERSSLQVLLCGGGAMSLPIGGSPPPQDGTAPCCAKGCHSPSCRKRLDRAQ
jgi:hypothetical protein